MLVPVKANLLERMLSGKYTQTIHIDDKSVIRARSDTKDFDQFEIKEGAEEASWSQQVLQILKSMTREGTPLS